MKKTFLLAAGLLSLSIAGSAQTLTIVNNAPCSFNMHVHGEPNTTCTSGVTSPLAVGGNILTVMPSSTTVISSSDYEQYPTVSTIWYVNNVHFIGGSASTGGPDLGRPCTGLPNALTIALGGCPMLRATWTALPGGSVQVDVN